MPPNKIGFAEINGEGRRFAALLCSLGALQIAAYYFAAAVANGGGSLATPQPDTLLYCQAARRIVEGHAFSFSTGSAVSTGTTSVLYPFFLALPYAFGATGPSLLTAGFALNAIFYLVFLIGWGMAFRRWLSPRVATYAALLLALFPQTAYCALAQSDTGLWMAVSGLLAWSLAANCGWAVAVLLCLGPWVRPEGMVVVVSFCIFAALLQRCKIPTALLGIASTVGVFAFNRWLTGAGGFSSVAAKGFFTTQPFPQAVQMTATQLVAMANDLFFGRAGTFPRAMYSIPLVGALVSLAGACVYGWTKRAWTLGVLILAAGGGILIIAQSGWQGTNTDRYLAWFMPLFVLFGAVGWCWLRERFASFAWSRTLLALPVLYSAACSCVLVSVYYMNCDETERMTRYAQDIDRLIPDNASVGGTFGAGIAYHLGNRHIAHLSGIYSPEYAAESTSGRIEILKNEPETRFDYWLVRANHGLPKQLMESQGKTVLAGPDASVLKRAKWNVFDCGAQAPAVSNMTLKCRVDVGYEKDEKRSNYEIVFSYGMRGFLDLTEVAALNGGEKAIDCGRLVVGYDEMTVDGLEPGRDVTVVLRVSSHAVACNEGYFGDRYKTEYSFEGENGLHLVVDGREAACTHFHIEKKGLTDVRLKIPGKAITATSHRIRFHGDHTAFGYWFYQ